MPGSDYNAVEPMQIDIAPEENDNNTEDQSFVVESPSLVSLFVSCTKLCN